MRFQFDTRGLEKFSLVEWPGKMTAIIFTGGCNLRCPFCHNPELTDIGQPGTPPLYPWEEIEKFLDQKIGWLDAVTITGGEPTVQPDLAKALEIIKGKGFLINLATNGFTPDRLKEIIDKKLVDRVCLDIKASPEKYSEATGIKDLNIKPLKESLKILKDSPVEYEIKITVVPGLINKDDLPSIGELIKGARKIALQQFRPLKTLDKSYQDKVPYCKEELVEMGKVFKNYVEEVNLDFIE